MDKIREKSPKENASTSTGKAAAAPTPNGSGSQERKRESVRRRSPHFFNFCASSSLFAFSLCSGRCCCHTSWVGWIWPAFATIGRTDDGSVRCFCCCSHTAEGRENSWKTACSDKMVISLRCWIFFSFGFEPVVRIFWFWWLRKLDRIFSL